jgi:hypothetical protein
MTNDAKQIAADEGASGFWRSASAVHDRVFSQRHMNTLKHLVIRLAVAGFVIHLALIFLGRTLPHPPALILDAGENYLTAISTPFNFILFYEVLTLIAVLHESTTKSMAYQFEIVSLIFIRETFHDIAEKGDQIASHHIGWDTLPLFADMWAGFLMYLLVAVFQQVARRSPRPSADAKSSPARVRFGAQKKGIALGLGALLLVMAAYNLGLYALALGQVAMSGHTGVEPATTFYNDLFTAMIFTDVLVLILSLVVTSEYQNVFRNAAFVVSIILIRFSLTAGYPFGAPLALTAMVFGIAVLLVFNYHARSGGHAAE